MISVIILYPEQFSLFSVVQFPNDECTSSSSSTINGTCYTNSECGSRGGAASGSCAAGFGVCCVISTTTCGSTISTNTTYIRNPGYPSSYTATAGSCQYTFNKASFIYSSHLINDLYIGEIKTHNLMFEILRFYEKSLFPDFRPHPSSGVFTITRSG